jgi:hypothetical protein
MPIPQPDISSAVLRMEDFPAGFEEFTMEEMGMTSADFENETFSPEHDFTFLNIQNIQMVFGFNFLLTEKLDRASFDMAVSQPDITIPAFVGGWVMKPFVMKNCWRASTISAKNGSAL